MSRPLVSTIIPCFNAELYVRDAICSALGQTYPCTEVIVIDDGSTDGSVDVLKTFGSVIRWETGPNRGGCAARNRGLELARGERIQFLDADDWLYPDKLSRQMECIRTLPEATPVSDWDVVEANQPNRRINAPDSCENSLPALLYSSLQTSSPLHHKSNLIRVGGFREDLPCSQERDLHLRLASHGWPIRRIAEPLFAIRRIPNSVSSHHERVLDQHAAIASRIKDILVGRNEWTNEAARHVAGFLTRDARTYAGYGLEKKATEYFALARDYHKSGGWELAYGKWARLGAAILGPLMLERLRMMLGRK
jgi:glycosyltransferase involved in cell wall biosynthesis